MGLYVVYLCWCAIRRQGYQSLPYTFGLFYQYSRPMHLASNFRLYFFPQRKHGCKIKPKRQAYMSNFFFKKKKKILYIYCLYEPSYCLHFWALEHISACSEPAGDNCIVKSDSATKTDWQSIIVIFYYFMLNWNLNLVLDLLFKHESREQQILTIQSYMVG